MFVWCKHGGAEGVKVHKPVQCCTNYYTWWGFWWLPTRFARSCGVVASCKFHDVRLPVPPIVVMVVRELRQVRCPAN
jgi:hypothetical protein